MPATLTSETLTRLLASLDQDREKAGEKYEQLRLTLMRFFQWRGAPFPEEQTDEVLDRVARKLTDGVEIRNISSYCGEVARLVLLEALKATDSKLTALDSTIHERAAADPADEAQQRESCLSCLDDCLNSLPGPSRQ